MNQNNYSSMPTQEKQNIFFANKAARLAQDQANEKIVNLHKHVNMMAAKSQDAAIETQRNSEIANTQALIACQTARDLQLLAIESIEMQTKAHEMLNIILEAKDQAVLAKDLTIEFTRQALYAENHLFG